MKTKLFLALVLFYFNTTVAQTVTVTTLAGGTYGDADGTGTAAKFKVPTGLALDASGNLYLADWGGNKIKKITPAGVVTTVAGSGTQGNADGTGTAAQFNSPYDVAFDQSGNAYVADSNNNVIRKITPSGVVSTFAGSGTIGNADGTGTAAQFYTPSGITVDPFGNIYVADTENFTIRKITLAGVVSTFAGGQQGYADGTGAAAQFNSPRGIQADASGNVYVADSGNNRIRKITPAGVVTTVAGSTRGFANGTGTAAQFSYPTGVAPDTSGNIYVADANNNVIRKITSGGVVTTYAGSGAAGRVNGSGTAASFNTPWGIAVDASGILYIGESDNSDVRKITPNSSTLGINENNTTGFNVTLYPNPASTVLNIKVEKPEANTLLTIIDVSGKTIYTQNVTNALTTINTSTFPKGVYFLTVKSQDKKTVKKFLVN